MNYMLLTSNGTKPPRYKHETLDSAQNEAIRLCNLHNCSVEILEVIGRVMKKEVPVTELKTVIEMNKETQEDDLPF